MEKAKNDRVESVSELNGNLSVPRNRNKNLRTTSGHSKPESPCLDPQEIQESRGYNKSVNMKVQVSSKEKSPPLATRIHCSYCNVYFNTKVELQVHCRGQDHQTTIMSDEGRDWTHRPPPRGLSAEEYALCSTFKDTHNCRLGDQCVGAHSDAELLEWQERFEYRAMKLERAKEKQLHGASYADQLLERLSQLQHQEALITEKSSGIITNMSMEPNLRVSQKPSQHEWVITLCPPSPLRVVSLLHDAHRTHFSITEVAQIDNHRCIHKSCAPENNQEWISTDIESLAPVDHHPLEYKITVSFKTAIYGTFRQAVIFDSGTEPVLMQRLCVDVIPVEDLNTLEETKNTILTRSERWCEENVKIVTYEPKPHELSSHDKSILSSYPAPTNQNFVLTQTTMEKIPTRNNYKTRLHDLLHIEELAQFDLMSRFNIKTTLQITNSYLLLPSAAATAKYSRPGELFGKLELSSEISEDSLHGRLVLSNCNTILVAPISETPENGVPERNSEIKKPVRQVYEVLIEDKTKKEIYLRFSETAVTELQLGDDEEVTVEVQFQLNRLPLCEMHAALDRIPTMDLIFPDVSTELTIPWNTKKQWGDNINNKLNPKQREALLAITAPSDIILPPILIIGPYGTGKTYTLAQGIKQILLQQDTRILICTHSNSAADLYIKDYLHPYVLEGHEEARPLRIYYRNRWVNTVPQEVQQYCLIEMEQGCSKFKMPTEDEILKHRVVVATLNTSRHIVSLNLEKGVFTHILVDEAAQAMECETLTPLALVKPGTRLVLAGDYMQLSPEVYSPFCEERGLGTSLLERLYDLYPVNSPCKIMLVENYRSHSAITKYTSDLFYEGRLIASGKQAAHPKFYPLTFFTARGEDFQDPNSTAFHNNSEVYEVCEQVGEIVKHWPVEEWGPIAEGSIGVVTPYADQMIRIRAELRKRKHHKISVERVLNVQGKQFRVIILSTVRTRHTCKAGDDELDFGFLSNAKLLTTAITRAQSLVAVVGDPVSLCSIGKCRKLWEKFLQLCSEAGSLYGITWSALRAQLDGVELKKTYVLNPLAPEFIPRYLYFSPLPSLPMVPTMPPYVNFFPPYSSYMPAYPMHSVIGHHPVPYMPSAHIPPQWPAVRYGKPLMKPPPGRPAQQLVASHPLRPPVTSTMAPPYIEAIGHDYLPVQPGFYSMYYPHCPPITHPITAIRPPPNIESYNRSAYISALPQTYHDIKQLTPPANLLHPIGFKSAHFGRSMPLPVPQPDHVIPQSEGDKSYQFLNNVHFPERNLSSNPSAVSQSTRSRADTESPLSTHSRESSHSSNSDSRTSLRPQVQPISRPPPETKLHSGYSASFVAHQKQLDAQDQHPVQKRPSFPSYRQNGEVMSDESALPTPDVVRIIDDIISDRSPTKTTNHWHWGESEDGSKSDPIQDICQSPMDLWLGGNQPNRMRPSHSNAQHSSSPSWLGASSNIGKIVTVQEVEAGLRKRQKAHELNIGSSSSLTAPQASTGLPATHASAGHSYFHGDSENSRRGREGEEIKDVRSGRVDVPPPPGFSGLNRLVDPLTQLELRDVEPVGHRTPSIPLYLRRGSRETSSMRGCNSPLSTQGSSSTNSSNSFVIGSSVWNSNSTDLHSSSSQGDASFKDMSFLHSGGHSVGGQSQLTHNSNNKTYAGVLRSSLQQSPIDQNEESNYLLKDLTDKRHCMSNHLYQYFP